jgi:N-acetylmuramoyl-L-alanine amidase
MNFGSWSKLKASLKLKDSFRLKGSFKFSNISKLRVSFIFLGAVILTVVLIGKLSWGAAAQPTRTSGDLELLARVIRAESEAEPYTGQVAVGAVILNRAQSSQFPHSVAGVIYQPQAFESVSNGEANKPPTASARKAAAAALGGWDPSGGALFFFNPGKVGAYSYVWTRKIIQKIGKHVFAL